MSRGCALAFFVLSAFTFLALPVVGQSVISTHSGVVHFLEGAVYLGDQPLETHLGKFATIPQGGELRTEKGRAEVLLTPGVFIRIGEQSAIRMVANQLADTRVELLAGSAVVDSGEPASGTSVKVLYKNWSVHFLEQGVYRMNSDPAHLWVFQGKAEVSGGNQGDGLLLSRGMDVAFAPTLAPSQSSERDHPRDGLSSWADGRRQSISADNTIAANIQDPASLSISTPSIDSFTNFPMLGLPSVGPSSVYSSLGTYQPGFSSIYLPGYTYFPSYTLLPLLLGRSAYLTPYHPVYGVYGGVAPMQPTRSPIGGSMPMRPIAPRPMPIQPVTPHPIPVRPAPSPGTHMAVHK